MCVHERFEWIQKEVNLPDSLASEKILPPVTGRLENVVADASPVAKLDLFSAPASGTKTYPDTAPTPVLLGPQDIRYDFNDGARVMLPNRDNLTWRMTLRDLDTGNILFQSRNQGAFVSSSKKFFVRFGIEVASVAGDGVETAVFQHEYDARGRDVLVLFPIGTLGDSLAWFPYADKFARDHGANVICGMSGLISPLLKDACPHITFMTHEEIEAQGVAARAYATYRLGLFFDDKDNIFQPTDFRHVGLHKTAAYILGVDPAETPARLSFDDPGRPIEEPYVCIAVQSSTQCKYWNNPQGWHDVAAFLKERGYRVICIDQKRLHGTGIIWNHIPHGAEDQTGDRPLAERARWLRHAAAFIGLSSGLSWLAWSVGVPVVMISGFTHPTNEFETPYRVINWHTCNSCWNDPKERFDHKDFLWCPRHAGTDRQFECTRLITSAHVIGAITKIPRFLQETSA
jgi:autotransporter strand-loop-strand O-heptosyltransferase